MIDISRIQLFRLVKEIPLFLHVERKSEDASRSLLQCKRFRVYTPVVLVKINARN